MQFSDVVFTDGEETKSPCLCKLLEARYTPSPFIPFITRSECYDSFNYGFSIHDEDREMLESYEPVRKKLSSHNRLLWAKYLRKNTLDTKSKKLKSLIRGGIPPEHRGIVWYHVSGAKELEDANPNLYEQLLSQPTQDNHLQCIKLDMPRTYPNNLFLSARQDKLQEVLEQYSKYNPTIGYRSGLSLPSF
jgi:hypothetical protein